jgi:hypothetical protein
MIVEAATGFSRGVMARLLSAKIVETGANEFITIGDLKLL